MAIENKFLLDKIILGSFASLFTLIQIIFFISILRAYHRIQDIRREDTEFINDLDPKYLEEEYEE